MAGAAGTLREFLALPAQGGADAEVVEQRGPEVLDDPALHRDGVVERGADARETRCDRAVALEAVGDELQIDLGGGQRAAELVVELARHALLLVFTHVLLKARKLGELRG